MSGPIRFLEEIETNWDRDVRAIFIAMQKSDYRPPQGELISDFAIRIADKFEEARRQRREKPPA